MIMNKYPDFLRVIILEHCDSTNNYIKTNYKTLKEKIPVLVTSSLQTAGRGRWQRNWISPSGQGLYSSFGFQPGDKQNLNLLPLVAGISVIETLNKITGFQWELKWPNDVLYKNKKVAGILIENIIMADDIFCIIGIGINLNQTAADFPGELQDKATSLNIVTGFKANAGEINPLLAHSLFQWLEKIKTNNPSEIIQTANRLSGALKGKKISFHHPEDNKMISGIFNGINDDGGMILENAEGRTAIHYSGEIV
jgi:BirA family transcriptional regulator, biotin operon repressor / biotin---[acetyl-CoA-carboxylase] ligase